MTRWLMVTSPESYNIISKNEILPFYGSSRGQNLIYRTSINDLVIFYTTGEKYARGLARIISEPFLDESPLYEDSRDLEWNQRVKLKFLNKSSEVYFPNIVSKLDLVKRSDISYSSYLVSTLVSLNDKDFNTILESLKIDSTNL